jgi:hypothetical protein
MTPSVCMINSVFGSILSEYARRASNGSERRTGPTTKPNRISAPVSRIPLATCTYRNAQLLPQIMAATIMPRASNTQNRLRKSRPSQIQRDAVGAIVAILPPFRGVYRYVCWCR